MSGKGAAPATTPVAALGPLGRDGAEPVFGEPWQAQAFALTVQLHAAGHFTWSQWSAALGAEIQADGAPPCADGAAATGRYYRCWLRALEKLLDETGLVNETERAGRQQAWARAYRNTPHGQPIDLANA